MSNSSLVQYKKISPNKNSPRKNKITKITIHHMAGNLSLETVGRLFASSSRQASSNYAIDSNGKIGMYVEEKDRAWTSSNADNDHQAVTIEVANDKIGGDWHVSDKALAALIDLCVDICKRNGIKKLNYTGDKKGNLTRHNMFAATACPGPYLQSKFPYIADEVNKRLTAPPKGADKMAAYVTVKKGDSMYAIAKDKGKKLADLQKYNPHVTDPSLIHVGDIIYLSPPNQTEKDYATLKRKFVTMQTVDTELYEKQLAEKDKIIKACNEDIRLLRESMKAVYNESKKYV